MYHLSIFFYPLAFYFDYKFNFPASSYVKKVLTLCKTLLMIYWRKSWFCYLHQKSIEFSLPGSYIFGGSVYLVKVLVLDFIRVNIWASQVALMVKNPPANAIDIRDTCLIPGSGRSPGRGHDNLLQHSCWENPMKRGAWQATVHRAAKSWMWEVT